MSVSPAVCFEHHDKGAVHQQIWEFPLADFLVCARPDLHGLYILSATARRAWELRKGRHSLDSAAETFSVEFGIPIDQAREDVFRVWAEWCSGLLSTVGKSSLLTPELADRSSNLAGLCFSGDYSLFGQAIRLRLFDTDIMWDLTPRLEPFRVCSDNQDGEASVTNDPNKVVDVYPTDGVFEVFVDGLYLASETTVFATRITVLQEFLQGTSPHSWSAVLHAGACGSDSKCVVFPGASHSGKTTLAAALSRSGLAFYGDDSIPLEQGSLTVQPMPFALMAREGSWSVLSDLFPDLSETPTLDRWGENVRFLKLPQADQKNRPTATALVFTQYVAAAPTSLECIETFDALIRLTETGFWLEHNRSSIASFLTWLEELPCYRLMYSDLAGAISIIHDLLNTQ